MSNNEGKFDLDSTWMDQEETFRSIALNAEDQDPGAFESPVYRSLSHLQDSTHSTAPFGSTYSDDFEKTNYFGPKSYAHHFGEGGHKTLDQSSWFSPSRSSKEAQVVAGVIEAFPSPESEDEPPKAPSYIEPNYHFKSTSNPMALFSSIGEVLKAAAVDFTVKLFKYKYKCVCYRNGESIPFDVRVYLLSSTGAKEYAVEFQRRKGDVIQFASMYHNLKAVLSAKGHVVEASQTSRPTFDMDLPELPDDDPPTSEEYEQTVSCLVAMFNSHCVDIQTQAIQALAQLTTGTEDAKKVVFSGGWIVLSSAVKNSIEDIHRCAVSGVANLLQDSREVAECVERTQGLIASIADRVSSEVLQVARESARALANLGKQLGCAVTDELKQNVRKLPQAQDKLTRDYLRDLQSSIGV